MSVQIAILGFLRERSYHGYELKKIIEKRMGNWTDIKFGSIYHALRNLEKAGFIRMIGTSSEGGKPARSVYEITDSGYQQLTLLLKETILNIQKLRSKDDMVIFFGGKLNKKDFTEILEKKQQLLSQLKDKLIRHSLEIEKYAPDCSNLANWLIKHHVMHIEVEMKWFKMIMKELMDGRLYPSEFSVAGIKSPESKT